MVLSDPYPVSLTGEYPERLNRFLWLIKWVLVIPNLIVLWALNWPTLVTVPFTWLFIIIAGRYPRVLWNYHSGLLRWGWRVGFYSYSMGATDEYPPFSLVPADYPAELQIEYPERSSRLTTLFRWLLAIPQWFISSILGEVLGLLVLLGLVVLLITGDYPRTLFDFNMGLNRWRYRVSAYSMLLRDEYPPFSFDP